MSDPYLNHLSPRMVNSAWHNAVAAMARNVSADDVHEDLERAAKAAGITGEDVEIFVAFFLDCYAEEECFA